MINYKQRPSISNIGVECRLLKQIHTELVRFGTKAIYIRLSDFLPLYLSLIKCKLATTSICSSSSVLQLRLYFYRVQSLQNGWPIRQSRKEAAFTARATLQEGKRCFCALEQRAEPHTASLSPRSGDGTILLPHFSLIHLR